MIVKANAKLNLGMCVTGKRADGYHSLLSLMTTVNVYDLVFVNLTDTHLGATVKIANYPKIHIENNSAKIAAETFLQLSNVHCGVDIVIEKHIPFCGGLGGSSADAAGVVFALDKLLGKDIQKDCVEVSAAKAGSDVAALLCGGFCEVVGRGDRAERLDIKNNLHFVIAEGAGANTATVFDAYDKLKKANSDFQKQRYAKLKTALIKGEDIKNLMFNDLSESCQYAYPMHKQFVELCDNIAQRRSVLTGSGSCVFWLCDNLPIAQDLCDKLLKNNIKAFVCSSVLKGVELL